MNKINSLSSKNAQNRLHFPIPFLYPFFLLSVLYLLENCLKKGLPLDVKYYFVSWEAGMTIQKKSKRKASFLLACMCQDYISCKNWTGGHFACACVHPMNVMAWVHQIWWREIENSRKGKVLLKATSFVLWIPYFPTKNILYDKNRTFSTRVFHL